MPATVKTRLQDFWNGMNLVDVAALTVLIFFAALEGLRAVRPQTPQSNFLIFLAVGAIVYLGIRAGLWAKRYLLWRLRNRLITAYIFIAVVPILLLLAMAGLAAYLLYWQLGSYVIFNEIDERTERVQEVAGAIATSYAIEMTSGRRAAALALPEDMATYLKNAMTELPELKIETGTGEDLLRADDGSLKNEYRGMVFSNGVLSLRAIVARQIPSGRLVVSASVPVTPELINSLAAELGPIQFEVERDGFTLLQQIATRDRRIPRAVNPFDKLITGIVILDVRDEDRRPEDPANTRVVASFRTRPSLLNHALFSPLGELGGAAATALLVVGAIFLLIECGSLITGIIMTRTITGAVDDLYSATQHVQSGDLTYRVRVPHRDQLAALGESFNSMTESVSTLIEEQRKRQRLENDLSIAREVQQQLFPHTLPKLPGLELEAICRAARTVSGDYYDFIRISPTRLAIALADISGKGISAALLMANVQAALRSDVLRYRDGQSGGPPREINSAESSRI